MATSAGIEHELRSSLETNPRIPYPDEIAISVNGDSVTLRGTVGSFGQRRATVGDANKVHGVRYVYDHLEVRLLDEARVSDAVLRGLVLEALNSDTQTPAELIDVKVSDRWVTLSGTVSYQRQSDAAYDDVADLAGVTGITNEIRVVNP